MTTTLALRHATRDDVPAMLDIYNHAVLHTTASYDLEPVTLESRLDWFDHKTQDGWPVLVALNGSGVVGWATFGPFREKAGYRYSVEHSVYVRDGLRGAGIGQQLMQTLIAEAHTRGYHTMLGGVDADNTASLAFHERLGFTQVAHIRQVGRKFDRWLDLVFMQRML